MSEQDNERKNGQRDKGVIEVMDYFVVALKMFEFEENGERVWFSKLVKSLSETFSRGKVAQCLDTLGDWSIISSEHGETSPGYAGTLYYLTEEGKEKMLGIKNSTDEQKIEIIED